jgi:hypothetical protein
MYSDHMRIEERSIALHREIAQRLRTRPELLGVVRKNIERWIQRDGEAPAWTEWNKILGQPLEEILAFFVSPDEKARQLRQSSPFCGILTSEERWKIYEAFSSGTYYQSRRKYR